MTPRGRPRRPRPGGFMETRGRTALSFWQLPEDDRSFLAYLLTTGPVLALPNRSWPRSEPLAFRPLSIFRRAGSGLLLLCREADAGAVRSYYFKA